ncbi:MAG: hypothetical protein NT169_02270 [Chloroflexi bacterium]|nr:hypothetical protein [Chloroflexota bacterium]
MFKKIILGVLATGLIALLVVGVMNRTGAKTGSILGLGTAQTQAYTGAGGGGGRGGAAASAASQSGVTPGGQTEGQRGGYGRGQQSSTASSAGQSSVTPDGQAAGQRGGYGRGQQSSAAPDAGQSVAPSVGQTGVSEWTEVSGVVARADEVGLVVQTADGATLEIVNRPWTFALAQKFKAEAGDQVTLTGFYQNGAFEATQISNATTGQNVSIRDQAGRPLWAGGGRRG